MRLNLLPCLAKGNGSGKRAVKIKTSPQTTGYIECVCVCMCVSSDTGEAIDFLKRQAFDVATLEDFQNRNNDYKSCKKNF